MKVKNLYDKKKSGEDEGRRLVSEDMIRHKRKYWLFLSSFLIAYQSQTYDVKR